MKKILILLIIITSLCSQGCIPILRSAKGLKAGEIQVSQGLTLRPDNRGPYGQMWDITRTVNARIGLHDKIELQCTGFFYRDNNLCGAFATDLFFHYRKKVFDIAFTAGALYSSPEEYFENGSIWPYVGFTISKEYFNKFNPYLSCYAHLAVLNPVMGCEMYLFKRETSPFNIVVTPEIGLQIAPGGIRPQAAFGFGVTLF